MTRLHRLLHPEVPWTWFPLLAGVYLFFFLVIAPWQGMRWVRRGCRPRRDPQWRGSFDAQGREIGPAPFWRAWWEPVACGFVWGVIGVAVWRWLA